jgi:DNA ligase-1
MADTPFARLANLGEKLERTTKRGELAALLADFLQGLSPEEIPPAVRLTIGQVFPEWDGRALNVSWKAVMAVIDELTDASPAVRDDVWAQAVDGGQAVRLLLERARRRAPAPPPLTVLEVFRAFEEIAETSGRGSRARKEALLRGLLDRATPVEAKYLAKVIYQEMRHGVSEGIMLDGIARAAGVKTRLVRRANQLWGDLGEVALTTLTQGEAGLRGATLRLLRPVKPMLAQTADSLAEAFERHQGRVALEYKLDGARVQIHHRGDEVRVYSRNLADVTASLPDVVARVREALAAKETILEGEAVAIDAQGRPLPFQHLMRRFRRKRAIAATVEEIPVQLYLFDAGKGSRRVDPRAASDPQDDRGRRGFCRGRLPRRPRGSHGQSPGQRLHARRARQILAQAQARDQPRPGGRRRRLGLRSAARLAVQLSPGCPRRGIRRVPGRGQDLQGADRRRVSGHD